VSLTDLRRTVDRIDRGTNGRHGRVLRGWTVFRATPSICRLFRSGTAPRASLATTHGRAGARRRGQKRAVGRDGVAHRLPCSIRNSHRADLGGGRNGAALISDRAHDHTSLYGSTRARRSEVGRGRPNAGRILPLRSEARAWFNGPPYGRSESVSTNTTSRLPRRSRIKRPAGSSFYPAAPHRLQLRSSLPLPRSLRDCWGEGRAGGLIQPQLGELAWVLLSSPLSTRLRFRRGARRRGPGCRPAPLAHDKAVSGTRSRAPAFGHVLAHRRPPDRAERRPHPLSRRSL